MKKELLSKKEFGLDLGNFHPIPTVEVADTERCTVMEACLGDLPVGPQKHRKAESSATQGAL